MNPFDLFELVETEPQETCRRIERIIVNLLRDGSIECTVPDRAARMCIDGTLRVGRATRVIPLSSSILVRALPVLKMCHSLLKEQTTATVREIYYRNKRLQDDGGGNGDFFAWEEDRFKDEVQCEHTVLFCMHLVGVTRNSLGLIGTTGKGQVAGLSPTNPGFIHPIPTFRVLAELTPLVTQLLNQRRPPRFLLIVEKHTILHRLAQSEFLWNFPCIAVTGKGYPDIDTRRFCRAMVESLNLIPFGICDMNPHGLALMGTYAYGSLRLAGEAHRYVLPDLTILGLTNEDGDEYLDLCHYEQTPPQFQLFTEADRTCLRALISTAQEFGNVSLLAELEMMQQLERKLELDAFETIHPGYLVQHWLPRKICTAVNHIEQQQRHQEQSVELQH